ncbi:MAG: toxin HicA [Anaerolineae bacterium]|nr:toxin HicA [Anaerolineae bacterium]
MAKVEDIVAKMRRNAKGIRFRDAQKVCEFYFGEARQQSSSHCVYKTPWIGDPRVNIQNSKGMAKAYQVRQILKAIDRLGVQDDVGE